MTGRSTTITHAHVTDYCLLPRFSPCPPRTKKPSLLSSSHHLRLGPPLRYSLRPKVQGDFLLSLRISPDNLTGRLSSKTDEWCLTYCSQTVSGRFKGKEPMCRSVCIRKVFPHEVRNIIAFKTHRNVGPDDKVMYPLPPEGQPANVPRWLGGKQPREDEDEDAPWHKPRPEPIKHWDEGWYLWTTSSQSAIHEKLDSMRRDLHGQQQMKQLTESRREIWQEYQDYLQKGDQSADADKWWGPIIPTRPVPDSR